MANQNSRNVQELAIGTTVSFKRTRTGERFQGSVFYYTSPSNGSYFGIKDVSVWRVDGRYEHVSGSIEFNQNDITELQVIEVAREPSNTQNVQNSMESEAGTRKRKWKR